MTRIGRQHGERRARGRRCCAALAGLLAATVALAGCSSIPTSGPVREGEVLSTDPETGVDFLPAGPTEDATPAEILQGFIAAATGPQDQYAVARQFLSANLAAEWDPNAGALIHEEAPSIVRGPGNSLNLVLRAVASVDAGGRYDQNDSVEEYQLPFEFVQEDGQWRISAAEDGLVLQRQSFSRLFSQRSLYFYDPTFQYLVPDLRWFPARSDASTRVVKALLAGPSPMLTGVVVSAFPAETTLEQSVTVESGTAQVPLLIDDFTPDELTQRRMKLQLQRSLPNSAISSAQLTVNGEALQIGDFGDDGPTEPRVSATPLVGRGDSFGFLAGGEVAPLADLGEAIVALDPSSVTVASEDSLAAVGADDGAYLVSRGADPLLVDDRGGLIAPTLDGEGYLWSVPADSPSAIRLTGLDGDSIRFDPGWSDIDSVVSLSVSRDSTRLLVLFRNGGRPQLRVYGILREDGVPSTLTDEPQELTVPAGSPLDATWTDALTVASLSRTSGEETTVTLQAVGGESEGLGRPGAAVAISGGNGQTGIRLLTADGRVLAPRGSSSWQAVAEDVDYIATQR